MEEKMTLSELQKAIRDSLYLSFPAMYWVVAEISELTENYAGHCFMELIEKNGEEKDIKARVRAMIWCKSYRFLKPFFENATGEQLRSGMKVLVRTKVEYHEVYGLSLIICDIDPAFTLGEMALKRQQIIRKLQEEGILAMNRELGIPFSLQRIAVISSPGAAGYQDFMNHLTHNPYGYVFYTRLFESPMQGAETEQGVISALDRIASHAELFDAVVIIRGGGSQVDLSWFDNYNLAYHITQFPLPVITGIGHDKDMSVTDMVACVPLKTPTAAADYIVGHMAGIENTILAVWTQVKEKSREMLEARRKSIESSASALVPVSRILLSETGYRLSNVLQMLKKSSLTYIHLKKMQLGISEKTIRISSPESILARGYTLTYYNGRPVRSRKDITAGDLIQTRFYDGVATSEVADQ